MNGPAIAPTGEPMRTVMLSMLVGGCTHVGEPLVVERPDWAPRQTWVTVRPMRGELRLSGAPVPSLALRKVSAWETDEPLRTLRARHAELVEDAGPEAAARRGLERIIRKLEVPPEVLEPAAESERPSFFELDSGGPFALVDASGETVFRFRFFGGSRLTVEAIPPVTPSSFDAAAYGHGPRPSFFGVASLDGGLIANLAIETDVAIAECHGR